MIAALKAKIQSKITNDKHFAELIKGSGVAFILRVVGIAASYLFTLLVTRNLGAEAWGNFALSLVVLQIASVIGRLGMDTALLRFTAEYAAKGEINTLEEIYKKALTLVVPFSVLVAILLNFSSSILASKIFHKSYLTDYFRIASFITVSLVLLQIHSEIIRGLKKIKEYMFLQQSGIYAIAVILFLIGLTLVKAHFLPIISYGISILILAIISIYSWRRYLASLTFSPSTPFNASYKFLLSVSIPMFLSSSLVLIIGWTDTIILAMFKGTGEVGIYNVALRVSMMTSIPLMAINVIAAPKFAEFWGKRDMKGLAKVAQQSTKLIFWTSFPILLIFLIFPNFVLGIFGKEFKAGATALMILAVGQFVNASVGSVGYILQMTEKQNVFQGIIILSSILNIILNLILIPKLGIIGAAISSAIAICLINIIPFFLIYHYYGFYTIPFLRGKLK